MARFRLNAMSMADLTELLIEGVYCRDELIEKTGLNKETVYNYCKALKKRGILHVSDWEQDKKGRWTVEVLKLGKNQDVPKPAPKCRNLIKREYMARKRAMNNPIYRLAA